MFVIIVEAFNQFLFFARGSIFKRQKKAELTLQLIPLFILTYTIVTLMFLLLKMLFQKLHARHLLVHDMF